jgi:hypothetical protein
LDRLSRDKARPVVLLRTISSHLPLSDPNPNLTLGAIVTANMNPRLGTTTGPAAACHHLPLHHRLCTAAFPWDSHLDTNTEEEEGYGGPGRCALALTGCGEYFPLSILVVLLSFGMKSLIQSRFNPIWASAGYYLNGPPTLIV